jgi:ribonucleoside-diphosphate reductase alpha chain
MSAAFESASTPMPDGLLEPAFDPNALRVLKERYFAKKADGAVETPREFLWRVASAIAEPDRPYAAKHGRDGGTVVERVGHEFYDMMARRDFMPNTPCLVNAGRPLSMLSACFVLPVPDSIEGIFYNLKAMALIQKSGGGCVSADSRVWTTFCGLEPIEVLFNRATADGRPGTAQGGGTAYDVRDLGIRTVSLDAQSGKTALRDVTHVWQFDVPPESQIVVRTREGTEVQTSAWHPFMVLRGRELVELPGAQLKPGDLILGPDRPDEFWPWTQRRSIAGLEIDEEIGWLIGFTLGAGSFGDVPALRQERLRWISEATDVLERARAILATHGIDARIFADPRENTKSVTTFDQGFIASLLAACGFATGGAQASRSRVPELIAKSPLSVVRAFVAGLLDGEGTVGADGSPSYATVGRELAHDLCALMSLLGYRPTLRCQEPEGKATLPTYTVRLCAAPQGSELAADVAAFMSSELRRNRLRSVGRVRTALALPFAAWRDELRTEARALAASDAPAAELLDSLALRGQAIESVELATQAMPYYDLTVEGWNTYASGRTGLALIHNTGFAFSDLRHQGAEVESTGKDASGPVSFMKVFNAATDSIKQGGVRRGANMGVLRVDHPDIFQFMTCKKELDAENRALWNRMSDTGRYTPDELAHLKQELLQTQINNFNISIGVTDAFMAAVRSDADFELRDPRTKKVVRTVKAREIWDAIVDGAWQNGEPGVLFLDHPDVNPLPGLGPIAATNPCVTSDTWVHTFDGPRQVRELIGRQFGAIVDGKPYASTETGFFFSGVKPVVRLETNTGFSLTATADHKVGTFARDGSPVWKPLGEFAVGEPIRIHDHSNFVWHGAGTFADGVLLGSFIGDDRFGDHTGAVGSGLLCAPTRSDLVGTLVAERKEVRARPAGLVELAARFGIVAAQKGVTPQVEGASYEFYRGFLQGWFDADGTVGASATAAHDVCLPSTGLDDLRAAQRMLNRLGIDARIYRNGRSECESYHELSIPWRGLADFERIVGFNDSVKAKRLSDITAQTHRKSARSYPVVTALEQAGSVPVFDCTVPGPHAFDANGLYVANCGEQFLHGYDSCNLGSINVGNFYDEAANSVDWDRLGQTTALALRFLDNVIDANIYPIAEIEAMVTSNRRVGLGIMGFAELLIRLEIPYGSPEAVAFAGTLMAFIQKRAEDTSETLARERGDFPNKHLSIWANDARPRRNAALLSIAPTGTISMIAGCAFGCEPFFGMAYTKHVMKDAEGRPQHLYYVVPLFEEISKREGFFSEALLGQIEDNRGSLKGLAGVPKHWQNVFTTSADVSVDQHIDMLAAFQKNTCNAVSKTINAPNDDTRENVARAIFRAYEAGCKGFTYYRDGSRTEQVVTFSKDNDLAGGNRDVAAAPGTSAEVDIAALLAKAHALLEVR